MYYLLNDDRTTKQAPMMAWARWFETADRVVEKTNIADVEVSTVFSGMNHQYGEGPPLLFETLVFGGEQDGDVWHYSTWNEAKVGHGRVVASVITGMAKANYEQGQERNQIMSKKVVRVGSDTESGRVVVGKDVGQRKGKGWGTDKLDRKSTLDAPRRQRQRRQRRRP